MALPGDSHTSGAAGTVFPTQLVSGKEFPVGMTADADGHIRGSLPAFGLVIPPAAVGAGKVFLDLHNGTSANRLRIRSLFAIVATDVAVTGLVGVRLDTMRTSSAGTSGTAAATTASASKTAASFYPFDGSTALPAGITARVGATGGAADEQFLFPTYVFTEETNMSAQISQFFNLIPELPSEQALELPVGKGLKVVQGSVASVGTIGFLLVFTVE